MSQDVGSGGGYPQRPVSGDPGTLDLPWYGIGFGDAVTRFFQKYARFDGRASRSEYWWIQLAAILLGLVLVFLFFLAAGVELLTGDLDEAGDSIPIGLLLVIVVAVIVSLATLVPSFSVTVRRLHDANYSGWFVLLALIPLGNIALLVMLLLNSNPQGARFDR